MLTVSQPTLDTLEKQLWFSSAVITDLRLESTADRPLVHITVHAPDETIDAVVPLNSRFADAHLRDLRSGIHCGLWPRSFWESELKMIMRYIKWKCNKDVVVERVHAMVEHCNELDLVCKVVDCLSTWHHLGLFHYVFQNDTEDYKYWYPGVSDAFHGRYGAALAKVDAFYIYKFNISDKNLFYNNGLSEEETRRASLQLLCRLKTTADVADRAEIHKACLRFLAMCPYTSVNNHFATEVCCVYGERIIADTPPSQFSSELFRMIPEQRMRRLSYSGAFVEKFAVLLAESGAYDDLLLNAARRASSGWFFGLPMQFYMRNILFILENLHVDIHTDFFNTLKCQAAIEQKGELMYLWDRAFGRKKFIRLITEHYTPETVLRCVLRNKERAAECVRDDDFVTKFALPCTKLDARAMSKFVRRNAYAADLRKMYTVEEALTASPKNRAYYRGTDTLDGAAYLRLLLKRPSVTMVTKGTDIVQFTHKYGLSVTEVLDTVNTVADNTAVDADGDNREWIGICALKKEMERLGTEYVTPLMLRKVSHDVRQNSLGFWCYVMAHTQMNMYTYVPDWFRCELLRRVILNGPARGNRYVRAQVSKSGALLPFDGFKWVQHAERLIERTNVDIAKLVLSYVYECDFAA